MKAILSTIIGGLALALAVGIAAEQPNGGAPAKSRGTHETFYTEVLKVFSVAESNAVFRAYLIQWKGKEVVASDILGTSDFKQGDQIPVTVMNFPSRGKDRPGLLNFQVMPIPSNSGRTR